ncbi:MAG: TetR/AcrR family transcriptional regulator, partial [Brachybacterium sp.]|nr:TetR/AcrR family transcriptional regulator [Brachybacterium sp.]
DAADETMFVEGVPSTPVDVILRAAGASPPSLYRHFGSKEGLLVAALTRRLEVWTGEWERAIAAEQDPLERLLAIWPALRRYQDERLTERWCSFTGTAAAFRNPSPSVQAVLDTELAQMRRRLGELAVDVVGEHRADDLAGHLVMIYFGTITGMLRLPYAEAIRDGERTARTLVELYRDTQPR